MTLNLHSIYEQEMTEKQDRTQLEPFKSIELSDEERAALPENAMAYIMQMEQQLDLMQSNFAGSQDFWLEREEKLEEELRRSRHALTCALQKIEALEASNDQ